MALGVTDVNGELGVSGGTQADLVRCVAAHWGFHYLATVSEAAGLARVCGERIHPDDQRVARERLAHLQGRVQVVSPPPRRAAGMASD
jgi:hypothetical protein